MEVGSVATQVLNSALSDTGGATSAAGKKTAEASPDAVAALDQAMQAGNNPAQQAAPQAAEGPTAVSAEQAPDIPPVEQVAGADQPTLGERILDGLGQMQHDTKAALDHAQTALNSGDLNAADMMRVQFELMQVTIQQDVTAKVAGKATQTVDTLLKNQ
jgi:type III secretion system YscI/HrpB-like protein